MRAKSGLLPLAIVASMVCGGASTANAAGQSTSDTGRRSPHTAGQLKSSVLERSKSRGAKVGSPLADTSFGNGVFRVYEAGPDRVGAGQFTVVTGDANPLGAGHDVLFGQGVPGTSYLVVRDVTTGVDYVQGQMLTHANEVSLDDFNQSQSTTGASTTTDWYDSNFDIHIAQDVAVIGETPANSRVVVTTRIEDFFATPHTYKIQYLWDTAIGADDGPVLQPRTAGAAYAPFEPVVGVEQTLAGDNRDLVVVDNDVAASAPTMAVALSAATGPGVAPDSVKYVCWPDAIFAPLGGYVTDATRNISGAGSNCTSPQGGADSAVQYLWSPAPSDGEIAVAASLRMSPPSPYASTMKAGPLSLGSATATLTDTATGKPIPGRPVVFSAGGRVTCTVVTDAAGRVRCGGLSGLLGYDVRYAGGAVWGPASDHGGLL